MEVFAVLIVIGYVGLAIFVLSLAHRLVKAMERIAEKIEATVK